MSIGEQIKKFRTEKSITQEQLGELVGVSTQAVSKWERGGAPDIELLPALSQALGVSIDALFGNDDRSETLKLAHKLSRMSDKEAYRYAFGICWALEVGLRRDSSVIEDFIDLQIVNNPSKKENTEYFSKLLRDGGISTARISPDFRHFFLMVEPDGGIKSQLSSIETLRRVFAVFADEKLLKIIFYLYSRLNTPVAASLISHHTGIDEDEVERCMEILCQNNLATRNVIATLDGEINSYVFRQESSVIPLLCYADEIAKKDFCDFMVAFDRTKPLL